MDKNRQFSLEGIGTEERAKMGMKYCVNLLYTVMRTLIDFIFYTRVGNDTDRQPYHNNKKV